MPDIKYLTDKKGTRIYPMTRADSVLTKDETSTVAAVLEKAVYCSDKEEPTDVANLYYTKPQIDEITNGLRDDMDTLKGLAYSPLVAATKSAMKDTTKVYVYTGNESGMTNGNWYYYDGSAWKSGGVYNSLAIDLDTTLTETGKAADAKAVGDEIGNLKSDLSLSENFLASLTNFPVRAELDISKTRVIYGNYGTSSQDENRISAYGLCVPVGTVITAQEGFQFAVYKFPERTRLAQFIARYTASVEHIFDAVIVIKKTDDSNFNLVTDGSYLSSYITVSYGDMTGIVPDYNLYLSNKAYDYIYKKISPKLSFSTFPDLSTIEMAYGGINSTATNRAKVTPFTMYANEIITAKEGYVFACYTSTGTSVTGGGAWRNKWTFSSEVIDGYIVFKKTDDTSFDFDTDGAALEFYADIDISGVVINNNNGTLIVNADTTSYLVKKFHTELSRWHGKKVAFIGDSITYGVNVDNNNIYYKLLNSKIVFGDVYADGVAGSCYSAKSNYGQNNSPIINRWQNIPTDRDLVVLFAGTNDWGHNTPLGTIADTTDVSFYGALSVIINGILEANPSTRLVFFTPLHRWGFGDYPYDTDNNGRGFPLKSYVDAIKEIAELYGVPVIDLFSMACLNPRIEAIKTNYVTDGLHPNDAGHAILADRIAPLLETV